MTPLGERANAFALMDSIPEDWRAIRIKQAAKVFAGGTPNRDQLEFWDSGNIPWLNSGEVNQWVINEPSEFITQKGFEASSARWIPRGALVLALAGQGKTKGMVARLAIEATCNQSMAAIVPDERVDARFLHWWLHTNYEVIRNLAGGEQRDGLNLEIVGNVVTPLPPTHVQRAIADFLDRETMRLDALVAAKQRLLDLIAEKRKAVIATAVTRGLDPKAKLRDSGFFWLGKIPGHWKVKPLKRVVMFQRGHDLSQEEREAGDVPVVSSAGTIDSHNVARANAPGIVTGRYGSVGEFVFVERDYWPLNTALYSIELYDNEPRFVWYMLQSLAEHFVLNSMKSAVPGVDRNDIHLVQTAVPPLDEQRAIVEHIARETAKLDAIRAATERTIALLKERRSALIAAAVTGQIDVGSAA